MAYIRTKKIGGKYEYRQLVETYREDGKHRQRVLAHLGKHETLEEAIEAVYAKVEAAEKPWREHRAQADQYRLAIKENFSQQIDKHHNGDIPSTDEMIAKGGHWFYPPFDAEMEAYRSEFGAPERVWKPGRGMVDEYEQYRVFYGWAYGVERHQEKAQELKPKIDKLRHRLAKLKAARGD